LLVSRILSSSDQIAGFKDTVEIAFQNGRLQGEQLSHL
jgi:hypothetical protein